MNNDDNSQDRKTRTDDSGVVHHTVRGKLYSGNRNEIPRGLTAEQAENQRTGWDVKDREVREAATGEGQATEWGDLDATQPLPGRGHKRDKDELSDPPFGKRGRS